MRLIYSENDKPEKVHKSIALLSNSSLKIYPKTSSYQTIISNHLKKDYKKSKHFTKNNCHSSRKKPKSFFKTKRTYSSTKHISNKLPINSVNQLKISQRSQLNGRDCRASTRRKSMSIEIIRGCCQIG